MASAYKTIKATPASADSELRLVTSGRNYIVGYWCTDSDKPGIISHVYPFAMHNARVKALEHFAGAARYIAHVNKQAN